MDGYDFEGTPAKLPDSGEWGAALFVESGDTAPAAGDKVLVRTRGGAAMTAEVSEVVETRLRRGGRQFACSLTNEEWLD